MTIPTLTRRGLLQRCDSSPVGAGSEKRAAATRVAA